MERNHKVLEELRCRLAALELERNKLRERVAQLEEALQGCLSRSRH
ncbi:hypothetical protein SAMN02746041_02826 [Desulfacinum hydrothermale DSM 13146]|uniref:Uncharacterized protein n=1 Tax=Desulfacinum hydrothermale DSM 13146 TaxID=1121390 RepID=A0A1W1XSU8_9BACT|nr:hypothetical protein [Desulfacinum hydrothermale]SMC26966.1 hypothetical protein SAMN02746041_02826 [Desulfacinum hydrothermale DSM 13146]